MFDVSAHSFKYTTKIKARSAPVSWDKLFYLIESHEHADTDTSSTMIRQRLEQKKSIDDLAHPLVERYIKEHKLLSDTSSGSKSRFNFLKGIFG